MLTLNIPGTGTVKYEHLVLDYNGTIAFDGFLLEGVKEKLELLAKELKIYVVTADTNGSVHKQCENLPVEIHVIAKNDQIEEKGKFVGGLNSQGVISFGNGVNDELMFSLSNLAIAVIGAEGCATNSLLKSNIVVKNIYDGLDLLLNHNRLIATLRK